jgi:hypothetical protein
LTALTAVPNHLKYNQLLFVVVVVVVAAAVVFCCCVVPYSIVIVVGVSVGVVLISVLA